MVVHLGINCQRGKIWINGSKLKSSQPTTSLFTHLHTSTPTTSIPSFRLSLFILPLFLPHPCYITAFEKLLLLSQVHVVEIRYVYPCSKGGNLTSHVKDLPAIWVHCSTLSILHMYPEHPAASDGSLVLFLAPFPGLLGGDKRDTPLKRMRLGIAAGM